MFRPQLTAFFLYAETSSAAHSHYSLCNPTIFFLFSLQKMVTIIALRSLHVRSYLFKLLFVILTSRQNNKVSFLWPR